MNIRDILLLCCGGGVVCVGGVFLAVSTVLRRFGTSGMLLSGLSSAFGMVTGMLGRGNNDDDFDEPVKRIREHERVDPLALRRKAKESFDFDAQVAQKLNNVDESDFDAQSSGAPKPKNKPENLRGNASASHFAKRELGARDRFSGGDDDPLGDSSVTDKGDPAPDHIDLGPVNLPSDRPIGGRMRRDRRHNRLDAGEDEMFGGMLDGDGDTFPDL